MAVDQFLKIDSLEGESKDKKYAKWIDVLAWSWGMSQSGTTHVGRGGACPIPVAHTWAADRVPASAMCRT